MSIQRYELTDVSKPYVPHYQMEPDESGDYVLYADHGAELAALRAAGRSLLACPHIAERDTDPDWVDAETEAAVVEMRDALKEGGE